MTIVTFISYANWWDATFYDYDGAPDAGHQTHGRGPTELEAVFDLYLDWEDRHDDDNPLCAHRPMFTEDLE